MLKAAVVETHHLFASCVARVKKIQLILIVAGCAVPHAGRLRVHSQGLLWKISELGIGFDWLRAFPVYVATKTVMMMNPRIHTNIIQINIYLYL